MSSDEWGLATTSEWNLAKWQRRVHQTAKEHGWWENYTVKEGYPFIFLTVDQTLAKLALINSEVAEVVEAVREGQPHIELDSGKPEGVGVELADVVIRVMDLCEALNIDLHKCMTLKAEYNESRPYKHGGKLA